mmetsp:Transcript_34125/g.61536  ORF Transcript_34125/g.61536 Transcript_34125/m.61536 type:complete len:119 (+) Transcript_34125:71-427(+)
MSDPYLGQVVESIDGEEMPLGKARKMSRNLFYGGFAGLPWLWFVNAWFFWPSISQYGDLMIKRNAKLSATIFFIFITIAWAWTILFVIRGQQLFSPKTYNNLDIMTWDLESYGFDMFG